MGSQTSTRREFMLSGKRRRPGTAPCRCAAREDVDSPPSSLLHTASPASFRKTSSKISRPAGSLSIPARRMTSRSCSHDVVSFPRPACIAYIPSLLVAPPRSCCQFTTPFQLSESTSSYCVQHSGVFSSPKVCCAEATAQPHRQDVSASHLLGSMDGLPTLVR